MPSPFPGMNPYLEQDDCWQDFHGRFLPLVATLLGDQVRPNYIVKLEGHLYVHELPPGARRLAGRADVSIGLPPSPGPGLPGVGIIEAPAQIVLPETDVERVDFVQVLDRHTRKVITVLELLSPSNKRPGPDRDQYLSRRGRLLRGGVNLVEIDLLRCGRPMPPADRPDCTYSVMVSRPEERPHAGFWPIRLRDPLPEIPVPLRPPDRDAQLGLQAIVHRIYDEAGYGLYIDRGAPDPPLDPEDAAWARQFLPQ